MYVAARKGRATKLHAFRIQAGEPLMASAPDSESAEELRQIAHRIVELERGSIVKPLTLVSS